MVEGSEWVPRTFRYARRLFIHTKRSKIASHIGLYFSCDQRTAVVKPVITGKSIIMEQTHRVDQSRFGQHQLLAETVVVTRLDKALGWARKYSLFPYPFATACCAMEYMSLSMSPYDIDRFGALLPRFSPRQADLLMVIGTVNHKLSPVLKRVYEQMSEPKWVMAFGACAASGGFYDNYATVQGIDRIIPVDVYVPGCPPRPEAVLDGLMELQKRIAGQKHPIG